MILSKSPILRASKIFQYFQGSFIFLHPTHPEAWPTWQQANRCLRKYLGSRIGWWGPRYPWSNHSTTEYHRRLIQLLLRFAPMEVSQASPADPLGSLDYGKLFPCLSEVVFFGPDGMNIIEIYAFIFSPGLQLDPTPSSWARRIDAKCIMEKHSNCQADYSFVWNIPIVNYILPDHWCKCLRMSATCCVFGRIQTWGWAHTAIKRGTGVFRTLLSCATLSV